MAKACLALLHWCVSFSCPRGTKPTLWFRVCFLGCCHISLYSYVIELHSVFIVHSSSPVVLLWVSTPDNSKLTCFTSSQLNYSVHVNIANDASLTPKPMAMVQRSVRSFSNYSNRIDTTNCWESFCETTHAAHTIPTPYALDRTPSMHGLPKIYIETLQRSCYSSLIHGDRGIVISDPIDCAPSVPIAPTGTPLPPAFRVEAADVLHLQRWFYLSTACKPLDSRVVLNPDHLWRYRNGLDARRRFSLVMCSCADTPFCNLDLRSVRLEMAG